MCSLPPDTGSCNSSIGRWYFNSRRGQCERFRYGGCGGNKNNFNTLRSCLQACGEEREIFIIIIIKLIYFKGTRTCDEDVSVVECYTDPCRTSHCPNFDNALCAPNYCGECSAHYYNSSGHDITMMCSK